jgi:DNA-binding NtrC family response regulator
MLDGWTCQTLEAATHAAALLDEIERAIGRAPHISSSAAIRAVRQQIERVAATDFCVLIEGASGPQPHRGFIDLFQQASVG